MDTSLFSFRTVRPVLFAGAIAVAWLTFSAPAGSADTGPVSGSSPGTVSAAASSFSSTASGVGSSPEVTAVPVAGSVVPGPVLPAVPALAFPAQSVPEVTSLPVAGLLQPLLEGPVGTVDVPVSALVPVKGLDPVQTAAVASAGPLTGVLSPLVGDVAVPDASASSVAGVVTGALQAVAVPVTDVAAPDVGRSLVVSAVIPGEGGGLSGLLAPLVSAHGPAVAVSTSVWSAGPGGTPGSGAWAGLLSALLASPAAASFAGAGLRAGDGVVQGSSTRGFFGGAVPAPTPAPVSGSGSSRSASGDHGSVAWLSNIFDDLPLSGVVPVSGAVQHVPEPVSFDPGSSPD